MKILNMFRKQGRKLTDAEIEEMTKPPRIQLELEETSIERIERAQKEYKESKADSRAQWELEALPLILDYLEDGIYKEETCILMSQIATHLGAYTLPEGMTTEANIHGLLEKEGFRMTCSALHFPEDS